VPQQFNAPVVGGHATVPEGTTCMPVSGKGIDTIKHLPVKYATLLFTVYAMLVMLLFRLK
jgi:hypothetical protein